MSVTTNRTKTRICTTVETYIETEHTARVWWNKREFQPQFAQVEYRYEVAGTDSHDGFWHAVKVTAAGPRVLKPAPDGSRRLGAETCRTEWSHSIDVQQFGSGRDNTVPEWLDDLVTDMRPSGHVQVPTGGPRVEL